MKQLKRKRISLSKEYCPLSDKIKVNEKELQKEIENKTKFVW